jgi:iron(III) transport system permease protein
MTTTPALGRWLASLRGGVSTKGVILSVVAGVVTFLVLYPLAWLVIGSFLGERAVTGSGADAFQGYAALFSEMELVRNSAVVGVGSTVVAVVLGVCLAWITTRTNIPWRGALDKLVLVPFFITPLLGAVGWAILASPGRGGLLNNIIASTFGLDEGPLNVYTPWGIIFVTGIYYVPFSYLFVAGALRSMDSALEEGSKILGGGNLKTALKITLPLIKPAIVGSSLLVFVLSIGQFGVPAVLGMPHGYLVLTTRMYQHVAGFLPNYGAAAAMGLSLFMVTVVGVYLQFKVLGTRSYVTVTGRGFRPKLLDVGAWKWPLFIFGFGFVAVAVVLPMGAIVFTSLLKFVTSTLSGAVYTLENYRYVLFELSTTKVSIRNTIGLAFGGATLALVLCCAVAWIVHRTELRGRKLLEYVAMVPIAIPGIVFSLGLLWAWIRVSYIPMYGTIWIVLIAYITVFLPYGIRAVGANLVQIDSSLEECASVCGAKWSRVLRTITLPLLKPGLWAGWTLLFVSMIKELSASALLVNSRTMVLSVQVFDLWVGSSFTRVAALSLIQTALIFVCLLWVRRIGGIRAMGL